MRVRVLFVCTANRARSPFAAALLRRELEDRGLHTEVLSAGIMEGGRGCPDLVHDAAHAVGIDLADHCSRMLTPQILDESDLVVGMAREHVRHAVVLSPASFGRSFTLRELVRRAEAVGPRRGELAPWLEAVHAGRAKEDLLGSSPDDDVADPYGGPPAGYARMASELEELVRALAALVWPC